MPKLATGQTLRSAERMLDVLKVFSTDEAALTMSEISTRLDLAPSTVRRILDALESKGFVRQDPRTGKYSPFVEIVRLAAVAVQGNDLISAASQPISPSSKPSRHYGLHSAPAGRSRRPALPAPRSAGPP